MPRHRTLMEAIDWSHKLLEERERILLRRLEAEHNNMRAALRWSQRSSETDFGIKLTAALWKFWYSRGYNNEGLRWMEAALKGSGDTNSAARAKALCRAGHLAIDLGDMDRGKMLVAESLDIRRRAQDKEVLAESLYFLALSRKMGSRMGMAWSLRSLGHRIGIAWCLEDFAHVALKQQQAERATRLFAAAEGQREALDNPLVAPERKDHDRALAATRAILGGETFGALWIAGCSMSMEDAIEYALV